MKLVLLALLVLLPRDDEKPVDVTCPVDGHKFKAVYIAMSNGWGGTDTDFCRHAYNTRPLALRCWTCPQCKFSGLPADFGVEIKRVKDKDDEFVYKTVEIAADLKEKLKADLKPAKAVGKSTPQRDIPGWIKYDLLAQTYAISGKRHLDIGNAYIYAAWDHRQAGFTYLDNFEEFIDLWNKYKLDVKPLDLNNQKITNRMEYETAKAKLIKDDIAGKKYKGVNLLLTRYIAATLHRKHGENDEALALIDAMGDDLKGNSVVEAAVKKMKQTIEDERAYQKKALAEFELAAEKDGLKPAELGDVHYMCGEIARRLGDKEKARAAFQKAADLDGALKTTKELATRQLELVK